MRAALAIVAALVGCGSNVAADEGGTTGDAESSSTSGDDTSASSVDPSDATTTTAPDPTTGGPVDTSTTAIDTGDAESTGPIGPECGTCNVWFQDCFKGQKCMPSSCEVAPIWIDLGCRDVVENPVGVGEPCNTVDSPYSGFDDCDQQALCWNVDAETLVGQCAQICEGSKGESTCDEVDETCFVGLDGIVPVCVPRCDPLASTCPDDQECVHNVDNDAEPGFACTIDELVAAHEYGDDCTDGLLCETGLVCRGAMHVPGCAGGRCCTILGDSTTPPACPDASQSCVPLYADGDAPAGLENLCFCGVPA